MRFLPLYVLFFCFSALPSSQGQPIATSDTKIFAALTLESDYDSRPSEFDLDVKGWICMDFGRDCDVSITGNSTAILINYYVVVKALETTSFADLYIDQRIREYGTNGFHNYVVLESYRISPHFSQDIVDPTKITDPTGPTDPTVPTEVTSSNSEIKQSSTSSTITESTVVEPIPSSTQEVTTATATISVDADFSSIDVANFTSKALARLNQWFLGYQISIISVKSGSIITDYTISFPPSDRDRVSSLVQFLRQTSFLGYPVIQSSISGEEELNNSSSGRSNVAPIIGGVVGGAAAIMLITVVAVFLIHKNKKKQENKRDIESPKKAYPDEEVISRLKGDPMDRLPLLKNIAIGEELGQGKFGKVYKGIWNGTTPVALKINRSNEGQEEFINEMNILAKLNHPNVVREIGIYSENNKSYLVLEYLSKGSLIDFLRQPSIEKGIGEVEKINMCIHVAAGMGYLEDRHVVHRDLAARNLLVTEIDGKFLLKIADFGLSREVDAFYTAKGEQFPVKWSSPEVIQRNQYSSKSDIWSFGVVMWEIFSGGVKIPYCGLSNIETVQYVLDGKRLEKPPNCPDEVYILMQKCWAENPIDRPSFDQIFRELSTLLDERKVYEGIESQEDSLKQRSVNDNKIQLYELNYESADEQGYVRTK